MIPSTGWDTKGSWIGLCTIIYATWFWKCCHVNITSRCTWVASLHPKKAFCQPWCSGCLCWIWRSCTELHGIFAVKVRYCTHNVIKNVIKMQLIVYFNTWIWYVSFSITPINAKAMNAFLLSKASLTAILKLFLPSIVTESLDWSNSMLMK